MSDVLTPPAAAPTRVRRRRWRLLVAPASWLLAALVVAGGPPAGKAGLALALALSLLVVIYLVLIASPTVLFTGVFVMQLFSGNWAFIGLPIGLDRLLLVATVLALIREWLAGRSDGLPVRFRAVHAVLLALAGWATLSALFAGTLTTPNGFFALLDRLGFVPFLAYVLAPRLYGTARQRGVLLVALVAAGGYLGLTALGEGLGIDQIVYPRYIQDDTIGLHVDRARGPFVEAVAMGCGLLVCAVGSLVAVAVWRSRAAQGVALVVALACTVGTIFTLTRAVWLGTVLAFLTAGVMTPALRRRLVPLSALGVATVAALLILVPGLADSADTRANSQLPLWDRYNSNVSALQIVAARPLTGVGWQRFAEVSDDWTVQADDYPVTGVGIEVHNVFLSHAAELGLPGAALYLTAFLMAVVPPILARGDPAHQPWRRGLAAVATVWVVVASFGPLSYAFPNTGLWLFAGIAAVTARAGAPGRPA